MILFCSTWQSPEVGLFICYNYSISPVPALFQTFHLGTSSNFRVFFWTDGCQEHGAAVRKDPLRSRLCPGMSQGHLEGVLSSLLRYPGLPASQFEGWGLSKHPPGHREVGGALSEQGCEFGSASMSPLSASSHHPGPPFYSSSKHLLSLILVGPRVEQDINKRHIIPVPKELTFWCLREVTNMQSSR